MHQVWQEVANRGLSMAPESLIQGEAAPLESWLGKKKTHSKNVTFLPHCYCVNFSHFETLSAAQLTALLQDDRPPSSLKSTLAALLYLPLFAGSHNMHTNSDLCPAAHS